MLSIWLFIGAYILVMSVITFALFGVDKRKAHKGKLRISERTLWIFSVLGGVWGGLLGMRAFKHKTKKTSFKVVMVVLTLVNIGWLFILWRFVVWLEEVFHIHL